ncbi:hypothetical protein ISN75_02610 [Dyella marensis]|uniref:DUF6941 family protein n=1 Tax=Dyella marensis TaxID=500610 RepID=UPI0031E1713E
MSVDTRSVYATFCDDIRFEAGNKISLIGVYDNEMLVQNIPTLLPKLGIVVVTIAPISKPIHRLRIEVRFEDQVLDAAEADLSPGVGEKLATHNEDGLPFRGRMNKAVFLFSPLPVTKKGVIRVHAFADGEELLSNGLFVRQAALQSPQDPAVSKA